MRLPSGFSRSTPTLCSDLTRIFRYFQAQKTFFYPRNIYLMRHSPHLVLNAKYHAHRRSGKTEADCVEGVIGRLTRVQEAQRAVGASQQLGSAWLGRGQKGPAPAIPCVRPRILTGQTLRHLVLVVGRRSPRTGSSFTFFDHCLLQQAAPGRRTVDGAVASRGRSRHDTR
jgi:hypothetical protein